MTQHEFLTYYLPLYLTGGIICAICYCKDKFNSSEYRYERWHEEMYAWVGWHFLLGMLLWLPTIVVFAVLLVAWMIFMGVVMAPLALIGYIIRKVAKIRLPFETWNKAG